MQNLLYSYKRRLDSASKICIISPILHPVNWKIHLAWRTWLLLALFQKYQQSFCNSVKNNTLSFLKSRVCTESERKQISAYNKMLLYTMLQFMKLPTWLVLELWAPIASPGAEYTIGYTVNGPWASSHWVVCSSGLWGYLNVEQLPRKPQW